MANAIKLNLPSADSLFTTQEERDDMKRERVMDIRVVYRFLENIDMDELSAEVRYGQAV